MEKFQHQNGSNDRRVMSRIDAALRVNYQVISDDVALNDLYPAHNTFTRIECETLAGSFNYQLFQPGQDCAHQQ